MELTGQFPAVARPSFQASKGVRNNFALVERPISEGGGHFLQSKSYHKILSTFLDHD